MATLSNISIELPVPNHDEVQIKNFIGGNWYDPISNNYIDNINPSTDTLICKIPDSGPQDVDFATSAAKAAFPAWSSLPPKTRASYMHKLADLLDKNNETFAQFETMDQGKTLNFARNVDISRSAYNFRYFADYIEANLSEFAASSSYPTAMIGSDGNPIMSEALSYTKRSAVGVAGLISPWNLPLYLLTWKIAPCVAAGNTCVCKPSEFTSVTAMMLTRLIKQAGIPDGVINIVFGLGQSTGNSIVTHKDIPLISFTGGTVTGKAIASAAAPMFKHLSLELGGKNPGLVFADCDLDLAIATSVKSSFQNQGEICLTASRLYVERPIFDTFVARLKEATRKTVIVGDPTNPNTFYGPLVSKQHYNKVVSYIKLAQESGYDVEFCVDQAVSPHVSEIGESGQLVIKGLEKGYFVAPTVITGCPQDSRVVQEEIFGPVVVVLPFDTEEQAIELANGNQYGLAATVWSGDQRRLRRVAGQILSGTVWCNCWMVRNLDMPFGGFKASGVGTEGGKYSIDFFSKKQAIVLG
ncbi:Aldehyde dehydrogenase family 8 member A1 [Smittium mucronatum]|uniref:Aldehyde dehydrogenase family 8 member A1 n=1 Tax=Smittium mucronatum TaxID=133383 RepID=A0A1R0GNU5_9FUNG|nr:Aldehyde dehydrogenase family 8 member A1 [Smittium mucronatum]